MALVSPPKKIDDVSVRQAISKLASTKLGPTSTPTFASVTTDTLTTATLTVSDLTASRLVATNGSKALASVGDLTSWVAGTANEIDVADDSDGTITLSLGGNMGDISALTPTNGYFIVGDGTNWVTESGNTARTSLGVGTGDSPEFVTLDLTGITDGNIPYMSASGFADSPLSTDATDVVSTGVVQAIDFAKTGWPTTPGVTLSFDDASKVFTVTDGGSAYYYIDGVKYTLGGNKTVDLDDVGIAEGLWYIYFSGDTLTASQSIWDLSAEDKALVAYLYWDNTNNKAIFLGWELHTFHMSGATHARLHHAGGARWETGLLVSDAGSEQINVSAGDIWDEDLNIAITDGAGSALFEQILSPAQLPIYYRDGASAWRMYETSDKAATTDVGYLSGGDLKWNDAATTWSNETVGLNNYVAYYVVATNEQTKPIALIMGQRVDNKLSDAKVNNVFSGLSLVGLPFQEMCVLARLILKDTGTYTLEEVLDLRAYNIKGNITSPLITQHAGLGGLDFASAGHSGFQAQGDVLDDLNTLGAVASDSEFLVGTGAGTLAWESGATARTSMGVGATDDVEFQSLLVDQNTDAIGLKIESAATTDTNYGLSVVTSAGAMVAEFLNGDGNAGMCYLGLLSNNAFSGTYFFGRNLTAASTDCPVVYMVQDHADDDQPLLELKQDGSGPALLVTSGSISIAEGVTVSSGLIVPDDGYIGSVSEPQAIQIEADGDIVFHQAIDVPSDIVCGGHVAFDVDNGHIGYYDNSPILTFNNADDRVELTGTAFIIPDDGYIGSVSATTALQIASTGVITATGLTVTNCAVLGSNSAVFQPAADSTTFFQVKDEDGNVFLTGDSVNNKVISSIFDATDENNALQIDGITILRTGASANDNVFLGEGVFANDDGTENVGIGYRAGYRNDTTGGGDEGDENIYIGHQAGYGNTVDKKNTGFGNIAIGRDALYHNTNGYNNMVMGYKAGYYNTKGDHLVLIGNYAGAYNKEGDRSVAIGDQAMGRVNPSVDNTAIGSYAGFGTLGFGFSSTVIVGYRAGYKLSNGSKNVIIGNYAGYWQTTNSNLLIIDNQDRTSAALELTNSLIYGIFDATIANQSLRINGEILGSNGAKIGDVATNYSLFGTNGDLSFVGTAGFYPRFLTQAGEPAAGTGATQCDTSEMVVWKDSDDNKVYMCFNDGGTVKAVELT